MSAADDALAEWQAEHNPRRIPHRTAAFMAGYRRALEDAADAIPGPVESPHAEWLRARAASTAPDPRETKD